MALDSERSVGIVRTGWPVYSKRLQNLVTVGVPTIGAIVGLANGVAPTALAGMLFVPSFFAGGIGAGIGLHRYFSHHAFETSTAGRWVLGIFGSWAWQGPIEQWVADHRRHHRFADTPLDPHSPHWIDARPPSSTAAGLLHAHLGWMILGDVSDPRRYAADIGNEAISAWCTRFYWPLAWSTMAIPAVVGWFVGGGPESLSCLVWAGAIRIAAIQHFTWAIASFGHSFGTKVPESKDESRDNFLLAALMFGEGLHSFHHAHPSSAINEPARFDLNGMMLVAAQRLGFVQRLNRP